MNAYLLCGLSLTVAYLAFLSGVSDAGRALPAAAAVIAAGCIASYSAASLIRQARAQRRGQRQAAPHEPHPTIGLGYGVAVVLFSVLLIAGAVESVITAA